jgi:hypothetical protein
MVLEPRVPNESGFALLVFFIGALLIALARTFQRDVFVVLFKSSMLFRTSEDLAKDGEEMSNLASTFLTVHFFGIFSYVLFSKFNTGLDQFYLHLALPAYLLYLVIVTWLFTRLSSSDQLFREIQFYSFLSLQTPGHFIHRSLLSFHSGKQEFVAFSSYSSGLRYPYSENNSTGFAGANALVLYYFVLLDARNLTCTGSYQAVLPGIVSRMDRIERITKTINLEYQNNFGFSTETRG